MNVLMISPGFPLEQAYFTRALAATGVRVIGVGDQPVGALPREAHDSLAHYIQAPLANTEEVLRRLDELAQFASFDRVECLWEPYVELAAQIREHYDLPGLTVDQAVLFRDKEKMKKVLDEAGIRTPRHAAADSVAEVWDAADWIGFPLIVKPIAGAGSADTYRVDSPEQLSEVQQMIRHVRRVSVEEFIDGEEFTHDTICARGEVLFENMSWYLPRPLEGRSHEWISPMTIALRDIEDPKLAQGRQLGLDVLRALGFDEGFTHLEWYRKSDGEVVFGEIGARPPGARSVDVMNYALDDDLFRFWADAIVHGPAGVRPVQRRYNAVSIFKRAQGRGRITRVEGLEELVEKHRQQICVVDLLPVGARRRDWRATLLSDGVIIVRHPELDGMLEVADDFVQDLRLYAE
ncbi:ATP-grasp domain-containing protein [Ornithinimicrobium sp. Y1847]|uniref:ATP-grasp domain-containing protein n=1 Tax=unclassified Ornithinimicrobium TaxID=2615080 RepID=UPI003B67A18D